MKTLKLFTTILKKLIKKNFFKPEKLLTNPTSKRIKNGEIFPATEVEMMRFEEYISRYKGTTRWQTV